MKILWHKNSTTIAGESGYNTVLPKAIVIEDQILVKMYQDMFDMIWKSLPKPDQRIIKKLKPLSDKLAY